MQIEVLIALFLLGTASMVLLDQQWQLHHHLQETLQSAAEVTLKRNETEHARITIGLNW